MEEISRMHSLAKSPGSEDVPHDGHQPDSCHLEVSFRKGVVTSGVGGGGEDSVKGSGNRVPPKAARGSCETGPGLQIRTGNSVEVEGMLELDGRPWLKIRA